MSVKSRFPITATLAALVLAAGAYTGYWFHVAGQLRKGVEDFAAQRRTEGWHFEMGPGSLFGFPRQIGFDLGPVELSTPSGIAWGSDRVRLMVPGLDPLGPTLELGESHHLALGADTRAILATAGAKVRLRVDGDGDLHAFAFEAGRTVLEQPGAGPLAAGRLAISYEWLNPPDPSHEKPSARFSLDAAAVEMSLPEGLPLERRLGKVQVEGRIMGTIPEAPPLSALSSWSNAGGNAELDRLAVEWGTLTLEGDGTFAFDPRLQPLAATTLRIRGWNEMMNRLVSAKIIDAGAASAAEILLAILARPDPQGRPTLTLAVTLQDGYLYAGQLKLFQVPPLPLSPPGSGDPPS